MVEFDPRSRSWTWNFDAIVDKRLSDNPVDLMISRLRRLPPEAQDALKLLACLGNHADFATLAKLRSESDEAMHAGFSRRGPRRRRPSPGREAIGSSTIGFRKPPMRSIPTEGRAELHLRIARLLVAETAQERIAEKIFDLVNQLNLGSALISEWPEKVRAAELNLVAGRRAKASTAYASASNYLAAGIAVLSDEGWQRSYDLTLGLFLERAECEILRLEPGAGRGIRRGVADQSAIEDRSRRDLSPAHASSIEARELRPGGPHGARMPANVRRRSAGLADAGTECEQNTRRCAGPSASARSRAWSTCR